MKKNPPTFEPEAEAERFVDTAAVIKCTWHRYSSLGQSPQYWLNLQATYDLKTAEQAIGKRLRAVAELAHA